MRRLDHSMIFLFIAGSYTPVAVLAMDRPTAEWVLAVVWAGALAGVALKTLWPYAPAWVGVPIYVALGWVAVFVLPDLLHNAGVAAFVLLLVGGALYTAGGVMYAHAPARPLAAAPSASTSSSTPRRCWPRSATTSRSGWRCSRARPDAPGQAPSPVGPLARRSSTLAIAARSSPSHSSACCPTSRTAQASASERDRATPESTSVSSTIRSGWRNRVMTGTDATVNSSTCSPSRAPHATLRW